MRLVDSWSLARQDIRVLDISRRGLKLRVPRSLVRGTLVQIQLQGLSPGLLAVAEVRYCLSAGRDFDVGVDAGVQFNTLFPEAS
jgi:hypothetical protein